MKTTLPACLLSILFAAPAAAIDLRAASFITKPESLEGFKNLMGDFGRYWLTVSALPQ